MAPAALPCEAACRFYADFAHYRELNLDLYRRLQPGQIDLRVAPDAVRPGGSPRDSLLHHLYVTRNYAYSARHEQMQWGREREALLYVPAWQTFSKERLVMEMERIEAELLQPLSAPDFEHRLIRVPWSLQPLPALAVLRGLIDHEVLQLSWNRSLFSRLGIHVTGAGTS
jgi:hypothetical protein